MENKENLLKIEEFITEHHVLTIASASGDDIWCANAFYAYDKKEVAFIITSEEQTRHIQLAMVNENIAGAIVLETEKIGMIRGLQFSAKIIKIEKSLLNDFRLKYLKRFPYVILKGGDLWVLKISQFKFTDNRLGFGKKIYWERESE